MQRLAHHDLVILLHLVRGGKVLWHLNCVEIAAHHYGPFSALGRRSLPVWGVLVVGGRRRVCLARGARLESDRKYVKCVKS